jgi:predicted AAA+ superfamily ATPase
MNQRLTRFWLLWEFSPQRRKELYDTVIRTPLIYQWGVSQLYRYRTQTGARVDIVLENREGQIVGIEVKSSETITKDDWNGIDILEEEMQSKFVRGIILYPGKEVVAFRKNRIAIPLSSLWESDSSKD